MWKQLKYMARKAVHCTTWNICPYRKHNLETRLRLKSNCPEYKNTFIYFFKSTCGLWVQFLVPHKKKIFEFPSIVFKYKYARRVKII